MVRPFEPEEQPTTEEVEPVGREIALQSSATTVAIVHADPPGLGAGQDRVLGSSGPRLVDDRDAGLTTPIEGAIP